MEEKQQRLDVGLPESLPTCGDFKRLTQVVVNVLANAHYHTPAGAHVTLTGAHNNGEILLVVRDDGPGISAEELESIFLHFHRFSSADGRSGLGLAIARDIVTLHQGRIWAESQPGHGTTFYIILPEEMQR
jgi:signal transduction histidine kinase